MGGIRKYLVAFLCRSYCVLLAIHSNNVAKLQHFWNICKFFEQKSAIFMCFLPKSLWIVIQAVFIIYFRQAFDEYIYAECGDRQRREKSSYPCYSIQDK